ncbi:MAG: hypothetical protein AVDCRST_MAG77-2859 [uncultured Chloroflexi bacterium]|uniref:Uncharacterized protein n=1 Tax=uncultured Chloroflexota bacterium TaxID=166587 RepID=A0A6J4IXC7_9CHLR|nr:MAG: hypothetical protein AVDCRST_MAG77-2859 [uncultured Chloroflexota bacterium]
MKYGTNRGGHTSDPSLLHTPPLRGERWLEDRGQRWVPRIWERELGFRFKERRWR